ncbi:MAG TPA: endo-1,3-alpha-glucanase family glycosylhydrolase [Tepidisphaeraceae bacterium]|nr:endo-1,3-alpha-glucanase family glycosylhydrolase [Tepidisphaeraceae bacterium]
MRLPLVFGCALFSLIAITAHAATDDPFTFPETDLMRAAPRAVFVAFMGDFHNPVGSGRWGAWAHTGEKNAPHDPGHIDPATGRRDIASCFYPSIGPYDQGDPDVIDCQCQLLKMAGIDGISFNLSFYQLDEWRQRSMRMYVDAMKRYALLAIVRFENKFFPDKYPDPTEMLAASYSDMDAWMKMIEPVQYRVSGRPVFMLFTFKLTPDQLRAWADRFPVAQRPIILTYGADPKYKSVVDGRFGWTGDQPNRLKDHPPYVSYVTPELMRVNERRDRQRALELLESGQITFYMAGVAPGFDDIGCWGWGNGPRKVERDDGQTYQYRWQQTLKTNLRNVFIPTWNDWNEGTTIEPSIEYGDQYITMTRQYAAQFKQTAPPSSGSLMLPIWIYKIRKTTPDAAADMSRASELIVTGAFDQARALVEPWWKKLNLDDKTPWDRATQ